LYIGDINRGGSLSRFLSVIAVVLMLGAVPGPYSLSIQNQIEAPSENYVIPSIDVPGLKGIDISEDTIIQMVFSEHNSQDPHGLIGSTYLNSLGEEDVSAVTLDDNGNVYVVGGTMSDDLPADDDAYGTALNKGLGSSEAYDGFIAIFNPNLTELLYCTYFGGEERDLISDIITLPGGDLIVCGFTNSTRFPTTPDAMKENYSAGDEREVFLAKFSSDLKTLRYCTLFGGNGFDTVASMDLGVDGSVYIASVSNSSDIPTTPNAYMALKPGPDGVQDVVVAKFNRSLVDLDYCTYLGGNERDGTPLCRLGPSDSLVVAFPTFSTTIQTSDGAFDSQYNGTNDTIIQVLSPNGTLLLYSTYFGFDGDDIVAAVDVDSLGQVYLTGATNSSDFYITPDAVYKNRMDTYNWDSFISILTPSLDDLVYSTIIGGERTDLGLDIIVDATDTMVYNIGLTNSMFSFETSHGSYDNTYRGGEDYYIFVLNLTSRDTEYASYFGGRGRDACWLPAHVLDIDDDGDLYIAMDTTSDDLPTTSNAHCTEYDEGRLTAVIRLNPRPCTTVDYPNVTIIEGDGYLNITWNISWYECGRILDVQVWYSNTGDGPDGNPYSNATTVDTYHDKYSTRNGETGYYWVYVMNTAGRGEPSFISGSPFGKPDVPISLNATSGDGKVHLEWEAPGFWGGRTENLSYNLYKGDSEDSIDLLIKTFNEDDQRYVDVNDLTLGQVYWYGLEARNVKYRSGIRKNSTLVYQPPSEPILSNITRGDANISLHWDPPISNGGSPIISYHVYSRIGNGTWSNPIVLDAETTEYTHDYLINGDEYTFRISAFNVLEGNWSETEVLVPYGVPTVPLNLLPTTDIGTITLHWDPPLDNNGSNISIYVIRYGTNPEDLSDFDTTDNLWWAQHPEPTLGVEYTYEVRAKNARGQGPGATTNATTFGIPDPPENLEAEISNLSVFISWNLSINKGGADSLTYRVYKKTNDGLWQQVKDLVAKQEYNDTEVVGGNNYSYKLQAFNKDHFSFETNNVTVQFTRIPGPVMSPMFTIKQGYINIAWDPPIETGGYPIDFYMVTREGGGTFFVDDLTETFYDDHGVIHNASYSYIIQAKNTGYAEWGIPSEPYHIDIEGRLGSVEELRLEVVDGRINITWKEPSIQEFVQVQGYWVRRGEVSQVKHKVATLGAIPNWTDSEVRWGYTYYYTIVPYHSDLTGNESIEVNITMPDPPPPDEPDIWTIVLVILVVMISSTIAYAAYYRHRNLIETDETVQAVSSDVPVPPWKRETVVSDTSSAMTDPVPLKSAEDRIFPYLTEEVFVVYKDGRLIVNCARKGCRTQEVDQMSGLLVAIQGLIQDGLESGRTYEQVQYGENLICLAVGEHVVLGAVVYGRPDEQLQENLNSVVINIEGTYTGIIENWTGDTPVLEGLDALVLPLIDMTASTTRDSIGHVQADHGVALLSAVDFHEGYVRLNLVAVNATFGTIIDSAIEVNFDPEVLRLERVEPRSLIVRRNRATLGDMAPEERKVISLLFDPIRCQDTNLNGRVRYYDSKSELKYVKMKQRTVEVACPEFSTQETADTQPMCWPSPRRLWAPKTSSLSKSTSRKPLPLMRRSGTTLRSVEGDTRSSSDLVSSKKRAWSSSSQLPPLCSPSSVSLRTSATTWT
jgi:hypothetical protein